MPEAAPYTQSPQHPGLVQEARLFGYAATDDAQIVAGLNLLFTKERHRVVFWLDPNKEFTETVGALSMDSVNVVRLDQMPALAVKILVERTDPISRYLLYMPFEPPSPEDDWLLDMRLYSGSFRADRASMLLDELGLGQQQSLRDHLQKRLRFLSSKDRTARLARLVSISDDEAAIDRKMLAILARADQPELFSITIALFHDLAAQGHGLRGASPAWDAILKFGLADSFWGSVAQTFGYTDPSPTLRTFLLRLMVTDFAQSLKSALPPALTHHLLPAVNAANAVVCLHQWRDSASRGSSYDILSTEVADLVKLPPLLGDIAAEDLVETMTFLDVEKHIACDLRDRIVLHNDALKPEEIKAISSTRRNGHWAASGLPSTANAPRKSLNAAYVALEAAADFTELLHSLSNQFTGGTARDLYTRYVSQFYRFDQLYRLFCEAADTVTAEGKDLLKSLQQKMEADYGNGFVTPFALSWGSSIEQDLLSNWQLPGIYNQYAFFDRHVNPAIKDGDSQRVFVIISDALRYEAAEELTAELNGRYRFMAELSSQLSVLPSCTALGMAALLPHKTLSLNAHGEAFADGKSTSGMENRSKILQSVGGIAVGADSLLSMKRDEGRAFIKNSRVVYIYHNTIDSTGDNAATEEKTFQAVRQAIEELGNLVGFIINSLNGTHVIVTADHGFLFQQDPPDITDKSKLLDKPANTVVDKKRYLLGFNLPEADNVYHGKTAVTARAEGELEFWIPKGTNRFHFTGGARYIHGGAMPQEVIVPIITVRHVRDKAAESTRVRNVAVHIIGTRHKITTNRHRFQLIQTEAVTDRVKAATLSVGVYEGETPVTNVETVTFESSSDDMKTRTHWVTLSLKSLPYSKTVSYSLILRNAEDSVEHQRADVSIDLAFTNDF